MSSSAVVLALFLAHQAPAPGGDPATGKPAEAPPAGPCASAKTSVGHWLATLGDGGDDAAARAAACTERPEGWSQRDVERAVVDLKAVLDSRGVLVPVDELPAKHNYVDPATGLAQVEFAPGYPGLVVARSGGRWLLTAGTLEEGRRIRESSLTVDLDGIVQTLPGWARKKIFGIAGWQLVFLFGLILIGLIVRKIVSGLINSQLRVLMRRLNVVWAEQLVTRASLPLGNLALAGVLAIGQPSLELGLGAARVVALGVRVLAAFSLIHLIYRAIDLLGAYMSARAEKTQTKLDDQLVPIVIRAMKVTTVTIGLIFILQNLDVDVTSLLTGVGIGGLAFALAAKDVVGNLFGSVTIFLDKPFQIGDWVNTNGVEGTVEEVGIRSTRVRTFYNSLVSVPNAKFTDGIVDNYGRRQYRRTSTKVGLTYDTPPDKIEAFCDGVRGIIQAHPLTRKDYFEVHFVGFGESGLEIMLYFFFECDTWSQELRSRHEVYLEILRLAAELEVGFAFPTRTLHVETVAEPRAITPPPHRDVDNLKGIVDAFGPGGAKVVPAGQRVHEGFYAGS